MPRNVEIKYLNIDEGDLVKEAYVDLLERKKEEENEKKESG